LLTMMPIDSRDSNTSHNKNPLLLRDRRSAQPREEKKLRRTPDEILKRTVWCQGRLLTGAFASKATALALDVSSKRHNVPRHPRLLERLCYGGR